MDQHVIYFLSTAFRNWRWPFNCLQSEPIYPFSWPYVSACPHSLFDMSPLCSTICQTLAFIYNHFALNQSRASTFPSWFSSDDLDHSTCFWHRKSNVTYVLKFKSTKVQGTSFHTVLNCWVSLQLSLVIPGANFLHHYETKGLNSDSTFKKMNTLGQR